MLLNVKQKLTWSNKTMPPRHFNNFYNSSQLLAVTSSRFNKSQHPLTIL